MDAQTFSRIAQEELKFLVDDFGAICTSTSDALSYKIGSVCLGTGIMQGEGASACFRVEDKAFRYWYRNFDLLSIAMYMSYLNGLNQPPKALAPFHRKTCDRQAMTEDEELRSELRRIKEDLLAFCVPVLEGDLTILELVALDEQERAAQLQ